MPGSATSRDRRCARVDAHPRVAFRRDKSVGVPIDNFAAQWLAYAFPCRRFVSGLATENARLGAGVVRYSFTAVDWRHLLPAGLPAHCHRNPRKAQRGTKAMTTRAGRRAALQTFRLGIGSVVGLAAAGPNTALAAQPSALTQPGAGELNALMKRLAEAPRRRTFKTVPMILTEPEQWDHEALSEALTYKAAPKQAWDNTDIGGPWLDLMRNSLNTQVWSQAAAPDQTEREPDCAAAEHRQHVGRPGKSHGMHPYLARLEQAERLSGQGRSRAQKQDGDDRQTAAHR